LRERLAGGRRGSQGCAGSPELGHQACELGSARSEQFVEGIVIELAREHSQHRPDRRVRKLALGEADAVAGEHACAAFVGDALELPQEPALADAGVTGQEDGRELTPGRALKSIKERGELSPTPNELGTRNTPRHVSIIPPS